MVKYKAITWEKFGGHFGFGDTPIEAWNRLHASLRQDDTRWVEVHSFVLVSWEECASVPRDERTLLGFGHLSVTPERVAATKGKATLTRIIAELTGVLAREAANGTAPHTV